VGHPVPALGGGHVHHGAAGSDAGEQALGEVAGSEEVHREDLLGRGGAGEPRDVGQGVDLVVEPVDGGVDGPRVPQVAAQVGDLAVGRVVAVETHHGHAVPREEPGERTPDPRRRSRDDEDGAHGVRDSIHLSAQVARVRCSR